MYSLCSDTNIVKSVCFTSNLVIIMIEAPKIRNEFLLYELDCIYSDLHDNHITATFVTWRDSFAKAICPRYSC